MFEKTKKFYEEHRTKIRWIGGVALAVVGGVVVYALTKRGEDDEISVIGCQVPTSYSDEERSLLEGYGGEFKDENHVPFATKDVATKFMEARGDTYQIDILDDSTSVVWICNTGKE